MIGLAPPITDSDHILGRMDATIELVEYGDFQCPHCGRAYPIIKRIKAEMADHVKFIFRNFPLSKIHSQAKSAAIAAEASGLQKRFWEMHDLLFENQRHLNNSALIRYGEIINLDIDKFRDDLMRTDLSEKVDSQFMSGLRSGVNATPTFFINGKRYEGSWEYDIFFGYLQSAVSINK